ncbi:MAG TPA: carbamoyl phosphate synthase small subunit [Bacillota bacterium]|nr:carbamoyl phosphate synthase small subunit [Bacillota bacterium]
MSKRQLVLEDGTVFKGEGFGSERKISGEVVFNTAMTGYQEIISDPSNCNQMIVMTYPLIGNYGINRDDFESVAPCINGLIVKEVCQHPSNFRSDESLDHFLNVHDIPGISGIDTRKLAKHLRIHGTMRGLIMDQGEEIEPIIQALKNIPERKDQVKQTSTLKPYIIPGRGKRIVLIDFGVKHGILRELTKRNCHVTVVPYDYGLEQIVRLKPDGILLSNGPGNPTHIPDAIEMIQVILKKYPLFGIGLGHQLFALACGADVEKMKFGHRGGNYPVKHIQSGKTYMTSQNHGYTVIKESLQETDLRVTEVSLNDQSVEGVEHQVYDAFSVQYLPESSPGPEDMSYLFDEFLEMITTSQEKNEVDEDA